MRQFVYVSFSGNLELASPLQAAKRAVEERLRRSGMTYTILRPSFFMEVWLGPAVGFDHARGSAQIYGDGERPVSWISLGDVAEFAVRSVDEPAAANATIELGGPEALSPLEVVRIFEEASGRPFATQHVPVEALEAQRRAATDPLQQTFATLMLAYAGGDAIEMRETLRTFPVRLTSVRDYAARTVGAPGAAPDARARAQA